MNEIRTGVNRNMKKQEIIEIIEHADQTAICRCLAILVTLAERALDVENAPKEQAEDELLSRREVAEFFGVGSKTVANYQRRYGLKVAAGAEKGKTSMFRRSEVMRVARIRGIED